MNNKETLLIGENSWYRWPCLSALPLFVVLGLTLYLFRSPIEWFVRQLVADPYNGLMLLMLPVVWLLRPSGALRLRRLVYSPVPCAMFSLCVIAYLANENYLGVNIFSAALFIAAIYSLLGLVVVSWQWQVLFLPVCLLMFALPFGGYLDIYLGFPLRLLCADLSGEILRSLGFSSITNESIILIEEKAANVDLACSGIKGMWAGGIFFLLLSMVEGHRVSWRWFAIGVGFVCCLLAANVLRIVLLVLVGIVANLPELAELVHQAMGLLGFSVSCVLAWLGLRLTHQTRESRSEDLEHPSRHTVLLSVIFIGGLILANYFLRPFNAGETVAPLEFTLPVELQSSNIPLTELERDFFTSNQAWVNKYRITHGAINGSALVVNSRYWKAQHEPHNCYLGQGYSLGYEGSWLLANGNAVRFLQLDNTTKTAVYWFQSVDQVTPNYSARVFSSLLKPQKHWLMVSLLFNRSVDKEEVEKYLMFMQKKMAIQLIESAK